MRCKYCGSNVIHPETQHKTFSKGKAVAGAVAFGVVGAAAGLIGKDQKGYKCGGCGAFMDAPMDFMTESSINSAVRDAESGRDRTMFDYFKSQYANIQANIPTPAAGVVAATAYSRPAALPVSLYAQTSEVKNSYKYTNWLPGCPVYIETIIVKTSECGDVLSLYAQNQSKQNIRSAYFKASVYDDTGDLIHEVSCVYQGLDLAPGEYLPVDKEFKLNTEVAYKVELICEKAALSDDSVWRYNPEAKSFKVLPQPAMNADTFPRLKYVRAQLKNYCNLDENANLFIPCEGDGSWQCICGHPALQGKPCPRCNAGYGKLQELISQKNLSAIQQEQVKARAAARAIKTIPLYEKAAELAEEERKKAEADRIAAEEAEKKRIEDSYQAAAAQMASAGDIAAYTQAMEALKDLNGYKDSEELAAKCQTEIDRLTEEQRREAEARSKRNKKIGLIAAAAAVVCIAAGIVVGKVVVPNIHYNSAVAKMNSGDYDAAITAFEAMEDYKDSADLLVECSYQKACSQMDSGDYKKALNAFTELTDYKDSRDLITACQYGWAQYLQENGNYEDAIDYFTEASGYEDAADRITECKYLLAVAYYEGTYNPSVLDEDDFASETAEASAAESAEVAVPDTYEVDKAMEIFRDILDYKDSAEYIGKYYGERFTGTFTCTRSGYGDAFYFSSNFYYDSGELYWEASDCGEGSFHVIVDGEDKHFFTDGPVVVQEDSSGNYYVSDETIEGVTQTVKFVIEYSEGYIETDMVLDFSGENMQSLTYARE